MTELKKNTISVEATIPGAFGGAFYASKNQEVTITDLEGHQVVDFLAFVAPDHREHLSMNHTAFGLGRWYLEEGDTLLTNFQNPIIEVVKDTAKLHNMNAHMCDPHLFETSGISTEHRSCQQNFTEVLEPYGIENWMLPQPFNIFQYTPNIFRTSPDDDREVTLGGKDGSPSRPGDYITLRFLVDTVFAVSVCPFDVGGFNNGQSTPIKISIE